jgi:hypothetical protein
MIPLDKDLLGVECPTEKGVDDPAVAEHVSCVFAAALKKRYTVDALRDTLDRVLWTTT